MPEALPGFEDVHYLILVAQLDRAAPDDEKLFRRGAILDQNIGARWVRPDRCRRGDALQIVRCKLIEGGESGEETGDLFHGVPMVGASGGSPKSNTRQAMSRRGVVALLREERIAPHGDASARQSLSSRGRVTDPPFVIHALDGSDLPSSRPLQAGLRLLTTSGPRLSST